MFGSQQGEIGPASGSYLTAAQRPAILGGMSLISPAYAVQLLERCELVAIPTETVYGLAGRFDREDTLKQIFSVKGRPFFDPLIVHVANTKAAQALTTEWPEIFNPLTEAFWPGPLTLVTAKADTVSPLITSGLPSVAVRCPRHPIAQEILNELKIPLAAPSANLFGHTSPTSAAHVEKEFSGKVNVVDGGECEVGVESTVISARKTNKGKWLVEILRPGGVSRYEIAQVLSDGKFNFAVERAQSQASPGQLKNHYQPSSPLVIVAAATDDDKILGIVSQQAPKKYSSVAWLKLDSDPKQAARTLYQAFRELSRDGQVIAVRHEALYDSPEWEAVWDRITRATSFTLRE